jgi:hypothetical protein
MWISRWLLLLAGVVALAAVHTDYDRKADFARYRTYSWIGVRGDSGVQAAVDAQLAAKGWTRVASGGDASVAAIAKDTVKSFYDGYPGWGWNGWGANGTAATPEQAGSLTVDVFDARTKKLIWRGTATDTKQLDRVVAEMFDKFPPKRD